jgi:hypothetical protein
MIKWLTGVIVENEYNNNGWQYNYINTNYSSNNPSTKQPDMTMIEADENTSLAQDQ